MRAALSNSGGHNSLLINSVRGQPKQRFDPAGTASHAKRVGGSPFRAKPTLAPVDPAIDISEGVDVPLGPQL
eukprot:5172441-Pyramimonas_sp.AAC.1